MSNNQVGVIYQQIIADVVESSRVDFEEGGVDERVLEELRQGWQQKLSQLNVATFPWDPKPEPPAPVISNPPTLPSNTGNYQPMNMNTPPTGNQPQQGAQPLPQMNNGPRIKAEPGLENGGLNSMPQASFQPPPQAVAGMTAEERAAANLAAAYGPRAAASIEQIQRSGPPAGQNPRPTPQQAQAYQQRIQQHQQQQMQQNARAQQGQSIQQVQQNQPQMSADEYRARQAAYAREQAQRVQGLNGAQTDGAGDDIEDSVSVIKRFNAQGEEETMGRIEIDNLIRTRIEAMGQSMEGGGLMLPLKQATKAGKNRRSKIKCSSAGGVSLHDGGDDDDDEDKVKDEDLDEDAINSDLDDPEDGLNDDEDDDESMGHIMLCMYDKVQRVKNKWKCVMKDGVLTVNNKEYVFHKASGEYEW